MPNNILITPGSASIQFSGSVGNTIRLQVEPSGSVAFYGNSGSLFGISDSLSGSLMSVNDISGLPILEVFSDDRVVMGTFNRNTLVVSGSRVGIGTALPGTDLHVQGAISASAFTGSVQLTGLSTINQLIENVNVTAAAPPTTFNMDLANTSIHFRSASTAASWVLNFRGSSTILLNDMLRNGQSVTTTLLTFNGNTAYSASSYQIDGVTVIPRWQGGTTGSASPNSLDAHQFTIIKIASASYHVLGSITKFT